MDTFFQKYNRTDVDLLIRPRAGETKLGQLIDMPGEETLQAFLEKTAASFVVVGIAEDIGVLANYGKPGAASGWNWFLRSFLNIQANGFTRPERIAIVGYFSFDTLKEDIEKKFSDQEDRIIEFRKAVTAIDDAVTELIRLIVAHKKTPIVVGGGHNNSYPLIKGTALALRSADVSNPKGINCINLDAHIDYRLPEGRHSGNGFR
jgi:formiminoglutamase